MPTQTFTNGNDTYAVRSPGTYLLHFLDGADELGILPGATDSFTTAYMGPGNDQVFARAGDGRIFGEDGNDSISIYANGYVVRGGLGNDHLFLAGNDLYADGGEGSDYITFKGDSANVTALGGAARDFFIGRYVTGSSGTPVGVKA